MPTFQLLRDTDCKCIPDIGTFPTTLDPFTCNRYEIAEFTNHMRSMAEALGRQPPASRYSPDMSKHAYQGTDENIPSYYKKLGEMYE